MLNILGADSTTAEATAQYLKWTCLFRRRAVHSQCGHGLPCPRRGARAFHASIGTMSGCFLNSRALRPIFILPWGLNMGPKVRDWPPFYPTAPPAFIFLYYCLSSGDILMSVSIRRCSACANPSSLVYSLSAIPAAIQNLLNVTGMTVPEQLYFRLRRRRRSCHGYYSKNQHRPCQCCLRSGAGHHAADQLQLRQRQYKTDEADPDLFGQNCSSCHARCDSHLLYMRCAPYCHFYEKYCDCPTMAPDFCGACVWASHFYVWIFLLSASFRPAVWEENALAFAILRKIILEIPALYILNSLFPLYGLAYAQLDCGNHPCSSRCHRPYPLI